MKRLFRQVFTVSASAMVMMALVTRQALADGYGMMSGGGWGHMLFGSGMMVLFFGGFILVIIMIARWFGREPASRSASATEKTPLDILGERFARGEIEKDEYEARKRTLSE